MDEKGYKAFYNLDSSSYIRHIIHPSIVVIKKGSIFIIFFVTRVRFPRSLSQQLATTFNRVCTAFKARGVKKSHCGTKTNNEVGEIAFKGN